MSKRTADEGQVLYHLVRAIALTAKRLPRFTVQDVRITLEGEGFDSDEARSLMATAFAIARRPTRDLCTLSREFVPTADKSGKSHSARAVWISRTYRARAA